MDSERTLILQTLQGAGWVIGGAAGAAAKLGLKRTTLFGKMKKLGISRPDGATNLDRVHGTGKNRDFRPVIQ
jgi:DNA-binding NtrC family response regulator